MGAELWAIGLVVAATMVGGSGPILIKKGAHNISSLRTLLTNYYLFSGIALFGLGTVLFIPALRGGDLSTLYPLVALTYVWVSLLSVKFLGERMTRAKWLGISLILLGVSFIGIGS